MGFAHIKHIPSCVLMERPGPDGLRRRYPQQQQPYGSLLQSPQPDFHRPPRPVRTQIPQAASDPANAWNEASKFSQSRRLQRQLSAGRPTDNNFRNQEYTFNNSNDTDVSVMRFEIQQRAGRSAEGGHEVDLVTDEDRRKMKKDDGVGNWIDKYQRSDHHADRLVRTIVQYETTTGLRFPDADLIPANYLNQRQKSYVSELPELVYVQTPSRADKPVIIETQSQPLRRLSIDRANNNSNSNIFSSRQSLPHVSPPAYNGRPPAGRKYSADQIVVTPTPRARSPAIVSSSSSSDIYRRRASTISVPSPSSSAVAQAFRRAGSISSSPTVGRYSGSLGLPSPTPLSYHAGYSLEPAGVRYRRASYSGASPTYPPAGSSHRNLFSSGAVTPSRHATPDRSISENDASRVPTSTVRRPSVTGSWTTHSRSASMDRTSPFTGGVPISPSAAGISDARLKIRKVLSKMSDDGSDHLQ